MRLHVLMFQQTAIHTVIFVTTLNLLYEGGISLNCQLNLYSGVTITRTAFLNTQNLFISSEQYTLLWVNASCCVYNDKIGKIVTSFRNYVSTCITSRLTHYMFH
jgi:hypothetical protein